MKTKSRNLIVVFLMVFAFVCGVFAITPLTANAAGQQSVGFAIKEHFDVYFAETGNNKVQNTYTGVDGKLTRLPELYRTDTLDYRFDGWFIADTDTQVTTDTILDSDVTLVDKWTYTAFDSDYKVSTITINNSALQLGTKQGEYTASVATANVDGITATSGTNFTIYKGLNKSGDALVGDEEVEIGKNYSVATTITLKNGYKFDDQIHFYASNGLAADYKFRGNFWTNGWSTLANQVEIIINFVQSDDYYFTQQPESREFENFTEYHYWYALHEDDGMEDLEGVQLQYYNNDNWTLFGPATMVVSPYANRTITFRLAASYEHGTIYSDPWTITWRAINPVIDNIALGVDTPKNGNDPSYVVSTESRFKLASVNDVNMQNGVKWSGSVSGDLEIGNAKFNNSEDYTVSIKLVAQDGYYFDIANIVATVNANEATITGTASEVTVSYTFEKAAPTTYCVYFNPSLNGTGTMETAILNEGAEYVLPECTFTPNINYEFSAWSISGELKKPGDVIIVNSDEQVYAIWQASSTPASYGFTAQPTGGTVAAGSFFTASFQVDNGINYNDVSVLEYDSETDNWNTYFSDRGFNKTTDNNGKIIKIGFYNGVVSSKILRLSAVRDGVSVGLSDTFTVNWTPSEFTKQPQGTTIVNGSTYTFTWDTTFDARFRILYWDTEYNDWSNGGETTGHSFSVTQNTTQAITYKVVADIPYTMANGTTNYVWEVATSQSFIVSWVEDVPEATGITATYTGTILAGTTINPSGIQITMDYSNAPSNPVNAGNVEYWYNGSQIQDPINYVFGVELIGNLNITVKYQGFETIMAVQVVGHTITFDANNGTGTMASVEYVGDYTLPANEFTAPTGKQFKGWALTNNGEIITTSAYNVTEPITLYAIWEDIPVPTSLTATYTGTILAGTTINPSGISITLNYSDSSTEPVSAGNVEYWYNGQQITNPVAYVFGVELIGNLNITIKYEGLETTMAVQIVGYEITFNANTGSGTMESVEYVGAYTLPACTFTEPDGKQFKGWSTSANGEVIDGATYNVTANVELFAIWEDTPVVKYDVTFNANGGTGTMSPVEYAGTYTLPACGFTAPDGKKFKGWATTANGEVIDGTTYNVTADVELYAIWEDIPHNHDYGTTWESDANNHWNECSCGDKANVGAHSDGNADGKCDTCDYQMTNGGGNTETPDKPKDGLSGGAIAGIVVGSVAVAGLGGFALVWFVIKKKSFADLIAIFKKK